MARRREIALDSFEVARYFSNSTYLSTCYTVTDIAFVTINRVHFLVSLNRTVI